METSETRRIFRKDYRPPTHRIDDVELRFELDPERTVVRARLAVRRDPAAERDAPLVLHGEGLELLEVVVDGRPLTRGLYGRDDGSLTLRGLPERCVVETEVAVHPRANKALEGLYESNGMLCTQCEAEGFRRITYFLDRPDVMARYQVTLVADPERFPVLLSNGNRVETREREDGRHEVRWRDPFPKPSYLFALVAGDLHCHPGSFTTRSGRGVRLELWVEHRNADKCEHALESLQKAMRWDEETFGLEYDLDLYMIVAVSDFNMGAMENKGLNLFNAKYVLASHATATDGDYENVLGVVGHEYFHNWTGNRVTCRDWFQLTLKEGLTVYRDQRFTADETSAPVTRINDVNVLRTAQFAEDDGPMAHPVRPESYVEMNNFYTVTVYNKGAEVVRMYATLLGEDGFREGLRLYLERHDGQAVTCDDFRRAMADAGGRDLEQFGLWYQQAGTPVVEASGSHDAAAGTYALTLRQSTRRIAGQPEPRPLHVPVTVGLVGSDGGDLEVSLEGGPPAASHLLELREAERTFTFHGVAERPVPSLLRGFSAPVKLRVERGREELAFLMAHDSDAFQRWDAGQRLALDLLVDLVLRWGEDEPRVDPLFVEAWGRVLGDRTVDGSLRALALALPSERLIGQELSVVDPDAVHEARRFVARELARSWRGVLEEMLAELAPSGAYRNDKASIDRRRLHHRVLACLALLEEPEMADLVARLYHGADNMTDRQAALLLLASQPFPQREEVLEAFHRDWRHDPLVLDKWFSAQALSSLPETPDRVRELSEHADFRLDNPNRVRSLLSVYATANQVRFHAPDGRGYRLVADHVLLLDRMNPQVASRLASSFQPWRRFTPARGRLMRGELERIASQEELSKDVREIVERCLAEEPGGGSGERA